MSSLVNVEDLDMSVLGSLNVDDIRRRALATDSLGIRLSLYVDKDDIPHRVIVLGRLVRVVELHGHKVPVYI